jgi:hypothetical protein
MGEYEFRFVQRHMLKESDKMLPWHEFKAETAGSVAFRVTNPEDATKAVSLNEDAVRPVKEKPKEIGTLRQYPACETKTIASGIPTKKPVPMLPEVPHLEVGTFDLKKWLESKPRSFADLPELRPADKGDPIYLTLLGPWQTTGWSVNLREIEWKDKDAIIRVDFWGDNGARLLNVNHPSVNCLVIPLKAPPGDYHVKVEWTFLNAAQFPSPGEQYTPLDPSKFGEDDPINAIKKKSQAKVTIK